MPASDIIQLSERVYALPGAVNTALIRGEGRSCVIFDTGQDKGYGQRLRKACDDLGLAPAAIVNSHAHADHFGGNDYLVRRYGVPVHAPALERELMASPYLEPVYLSQGAKPLPELVSKWLMAPASAVDRLLEPGSVELAGVELRLIDTSGHAHRQLSVLVDGVLLAADALFGASVLERYPLPFGQDVGAQIASAERLLGSGASCVLPGHGDASDRPDELVEANLAAFARAADVVAEACRDVPLEEVLAESCRALGIAVADLPRYHLNRCTVAAYLCHLRDQGRADCRLSDNRLLWGRPSPA